MDHRIAPTNRRLARVCRTDVAFKKLAVCTALRRKQSQVVTLDCRVIKSVEIIQDVHLTAGREQPLADMRAYEAGAAGDECAILI